MQKELQSNQDELTELYEELAKMMMKFGLNTMNFLQPKIF